ncbi:MAG: helix-turn-helix domain-containing protein [Pyramidobacter sp.]|uniref:helix-turn-helix domain-containing protein n=1 Tax=Pyramidobacter sp. TaxID=1943581 RepID=UPI0025F8A91D|nr:helix-turn-helix transcriptional regulator [Pyramidobacter sp.]MCI7403911.1 helix-turn-helix domain-containing protein [Pyramidobacter sp.]
MGIGERIKRRRIELGITQTQLAQKIGVYRPTISDWERGAAENILVGNLRKVAEVLHTTPNDLLGVNEKEGENK